MNFFFCFHQYGFVYAQVYVKCVQIFMLSTKFAGLFSFGFIHQFILSFQKNCYHNAGIQLII